MVTQQRIGSTTQLGRFSLPRQYDSFMQADVFLSNDARMDYLQSNLVADSSHDEAISHRVIMT